MPTLLLSCPSYSPPCCLPFHLSVPLLVSLTSTAILPYLTILFTTMPILIPTCLSHPVVPFTALLLILISPLLQSCPSCCTLYCPSTHPTVPFTVCPSFYPLLPSCLSFALSCPPACLTALLPILQPSSLSFCPLVMSLLLPSQFFPLSGPFYYPAVSFTSFCPPQVILPFNFPLPFPCTGAMGISTNHHYHPPCSVNYKACFSTVVDLPSFCSVLVPLLVFL